MPVEKVYFNNSKGMKLAGWLHTPNQQPSKSVKYPAVVRSHGYKGSKEGRTSTGLVAMFNDMVYLRFDMHGHGESEGLPEEIDANICVDDVKSAVEFVAGLDIVDEHRIAITGSSLGGLATTLAAAWCDKVACAVPVCPVSDFDLFRKSHVRYQKLIEHLGQDDVYKEAERITVPVFIIHGDSDTVVPVTQSLELVKHLKNGVLHIIPGADHTFSKERHRKQMLEQISEFIHKTLGNGNESNSV
jgi:dipeptidyl aminopeptidase/acylaminoacyl peptidase